MWYILAPYKPELTINQLFTEEATRTDEQKLLHHLLREYEKAVRPVRNASHTITVKLGMTMTNIFEMDERNQVLTINVWLDQEWKDELLRWDPKQFGGIESIRIPCDLIWLPDIVLYNNADDYTAGYMRSRAMVFYDGTVFWPPPTQLRSTCKIDVTYFPFDSQHCALKFGSWTYHGKYASERGSVQVRLSLDIRSVLSFHHREAFNSAVPEWIHQLVLHNLRRALCMRPPLAHNSDFCSANGTHSFVTATAFDDPNGGNFDEADMQFSKMQETAIINVDEELPATHKKKRMSNELPMHRLMKTLVVLMRRQQMEDHCQALVNEWRQVAQVIDRL
ncbi:unnamed protein product, partial [Anisakis simplex]|uniref:Neur_chan_LBD domain-containing protein n=1 Tax=Anisakis simplex TaxID=6269 RepID=A0A0M3JSV8_ANISI